MKLSEQLNKNINDAEKMSKAFKAYKNAIQISQEINDLADKADKLVDKMKIEYEQLID